MSNSFTAKVLDYVRTFYQREPN